MAPRADGHHGGRRGCGRSRRWREFTVRLASWRRQAGFSQACNPVTLTDSL